MLLNGVALFFHMNLALLKTRNRLTRISRQSWTLVEAVIVVLVLSLADLWLAYSSVIRLSFIGARYVI